MFGGKYMTPRQKVLQYVVESILVLPRHAVLRVGIDGDAGAGKSTFGDELLSALLSAGRPVIRASTDSFHNPREIRYRLGKMSPDGFFLDSYNYPLLIDLLLRPLSPGGSGHFRRVGFDHRIDLPVAALTEQAESNSILIFDGIFLHRSELQSYWDYSVFLDVTPETGLKRCAMRGDGSADPFADSNFRYVEGQKKYLRECQPKKLATIVIDNEDWDAPEIRSNRAVRQIPLTPGR